MQRRCHEFVSRDVGNSTFLYPGFLRSLSLLSSFSNTRFICLEKNKMALKLKSPQRKPTACEKCPQWAKDKLQSQLKTGGSPRSELWFWRSIALWAALSPPSQQVSIVHIQASYAFRLSSLVPPHKSLLVCSVCKEAAKLVPLPCL